MNPDTGEIKEILPEDFQQAIEEGWVEWKLHEKVEIKNCLFEVQAINCAENTITLKGVGKTKIK